MSTYPRRVHPSAFAHASTTAHRTRPPVSHATYTPHVASPHPRSTPAQASIPDLREAINSLDSKMASLMHERHKLESHLERALLSSIFVIGVLDAADDNPVMVPTLMLVCRYWQDVVLDTPVLWSKITVGPHDSLEKARRKLTRSKACPLDIIVNFGTRTEYVSNVTEQVVHAMDLIRPALWRTRSFSLSVPNRPQAHAALLRCQEDAPLLETLCIRIYRSMQDDRYSSPPLPLFNGHTPRLRSCSLTSFNFGWDHRLVSRLNVLKLEGYFNGFTPTAPVLLAILRSCPELEELALRNLSDVDSDPCFHAPPPDQFVPPQQIGRVSLPRLKKITFYYAGIALAREIMSHITFPNLQSLDMSYLQNVTPILQLLYDQALTRLPLRVLRIESCLYSEIKFVDLLRRLPSLAELDLVDIEDASSGFLKASRGLSSAQPWVCPKLESLTLDGCTSIDWDALRTFVESRLPSNSYPRYHDAQAFRSSPLTFTSASSAAARSTRNRTQARPAPQTMMAPQRLRAIDVTRCHQMSKEMVQWLRMYVSEVKCEPAKGVWGEPMAP
ncbi:hypothetical protein BDZ89DRAFT_1073393 [Hymenopellis radicata]|nr:hypothetical protein BDZ89DRAFT_1073393 [Hymenopellis radicata]